MSKHTPGLWSVAHVCGTCYQVQCAERQYHIGTIRGKQNAMLIAAAPDLLEALQRLAKAMSVPAYDAERPNALNQAQKAIAKATGAAT